MDGIFNAEHFELNSLSLPYLTAAFGLVAISTYALFINGLRLLRASFLVCGFSLALVTMCYGFVAMTRPEHHAVAEVIHRWAASLIPMTAAGIFAYVTVQLNQHRRLGWLVIAALAVALVQMPIVLTTTWYIEDVRHTKTMVLGQQLFHVSAGPLLPLLMVTSLAWLVTSGVLVYRQLRLAEAAARRQQLRRLLIALSVFCLCSVDILLAYGISNVPLSWLFAGVGTIYLFRTLIADELIHTHTLDYQAPLILVYTLAAVLGLVLAWSLASETSPVLLGVLFIGVYLALRIGIAIRNLENREHEAMADTPRERLLEDYVTNLQTAEELTDTTSQLQQSLADTTSQTLQRGLECGYVELFLMSEDFVLRTVDGEILSESAPHVAFLYNWPPEHAQPLQRSEFDSLDLEFLREPIEAVMDMGASRADVLLPLVNGYELLGLVLVGEFPHEHSLHLEEIVFARRIQEHLTEALLYSRMRERANARVAMQKEVEVAAAIQRAFVSHEELVDFGTVQVSGLWVPATQCGGDWWSVHQMPDKQRILVLIGDVTGHGVAAAMVTAAAKGCYDAAQRLMGDDIDIDKLLKYLDDIVRQVGAGRFNMTCFATLLDPREGKVYFANAGHVVPYICRPNDKGGWQLSALVARGNPLGAGEKPLYQSKVQDLASGDILVWYTDGIVECANPQQQLFSDRRLQRLLRKIDTRQPNPRNVRDRIMHEVHNFRDDQPPDDDITLVIARVA